MIILIDGYNLLKQVYLGFKGKLEKQRDNFIKELGYYKNKKSGGVKDIIIVFDGGLPDRATREIKNNIVVIFSGQKESADDWIFNYVEKHKQEEFLLISNDRDLISRCKKVCYNIDSLEVLAFYDLVETVILQGTEINNKKNIKTNNILKFDPSNQDEFYELGNLDLGNINNLEIDRQGLDLLMSQTDLSEYNKIEQEQNLSRESKSLTLSKKEKKIVKKIKKL